MILPPSKPKKENKMLTQLFNFIILRNLLTNIGNWFNYLQKKDCLLACLKELKRNGKILNSRVEIFKRFIGKSVQNKHVLNTNNCTVEKK